MSEIVKILEEEGFREKPYQDHLGNWTFGHGLTWISEQESMKIAEGRFNQNVLELSHKVSCRGGALAILGHMSYQLGVQGTLNFKKMIAALEAEDYETAADEMLDSRWAKQTPERAKRLSDRMRALGGMG